MVLVGDFPLYLFLIECTTLCSGGSRQIIAEMSLGPSSRLLPTWQLSLSSWVIFDWGCLWGRCGLVCRIAPSGHFVLEYTLFPGFTLEHYIPILEICCAPKLSCDPSQTPVPGCLLLPLKPCSSSPDAILFFFFLIYLFYLFLAALGLCYCTWAFSSCGEKGLLFIAVRGLLIAVASLVAEQGL